MHKLQFVSLFGILVILGLLFACSKNRRAIKWRLVLTGLGIQVVLGLTFLYWERGRLFLWDVGEGFKRFLDTASAGTDFVFGGLSSGNAQVKKFLSVIRGEMKDKREMVMQTHGGEVTHRYMGRSVTIKDAKKLASAIKKIYLGGGSPAPTLLKDVRKRGTAKP